jgi:hypothetical protein
MSCFWHKQTCFDNANSGNIDFLYDSAPSDYIVIILAGNSHYLTLGTYQAIKDEINF